MIKYKGINQNILSGKIIGGCTLLLIGKLQIIYNKQLLLKWFLNKRLLDARFAKLLQRVKIYQEYSLEQLSIEQLF